MSRRQLPDSIRQAFGSITRPPRPQLAGRIRDSIWARPAPAVVTPPPPPPPGTTVVTPRAIPRPPAALIAALVVIALLAATVLAAPALLNGAGGLSRQVASLAQSFNRGSGGGQPTSRAASSTPSASHSPSASPTASAIPSPAETPAPAPPPVAAAPPAPPVQPLPGYTCTNFSGQGVASTGMTSARTGAHGAFDRFVIQFSGGVPSFDVQPQAVPTFGGTTLRGSAGILIELHGATGAGVFSGPTDLPQSYAVIREAKLLGDSGGTVAWGIGVAHATCFHAWTLPSPNRLVIDVQS